MVEIIFGKWDKILSRGFILCLLIFILIPESGICQNKVTPNQGRRIEILHSDIWEVNEKIDKDLQQLLGNVQLRHKEMIMSCDSAYYYQKMNQVKAFGRIHIEQGDTLDIYGNYLFYDGRTEFAALEGNVELVDKETHLYTESVTYDFTTEVARYVNDGRITNGDNTLTSKIGFYFVSENLFHFKDSVRIVNPDYVMTADTMDYNTKSETAIFTGPSQMEGDSIYLYCERGWYDTKNNVTRIWTNALIDNRQQIIEGDSLYYDENTGFGQSFGNISIADTNNHVVVKGQYAWYYKEPERFMVTDSAVFIQISENDSLFLHADTISAETISGRQKDAYRLMKAYFGCRIFSRSLQAKCDSLSYSLQDSVIRLYYQPVLWSEENQLTSDSMAIYTKNSAADRMELYNSAFVVSQVDTIRFNQIKGRSLTGYFKDNELYKIDIKGNGESIYYLVDGDDVVGVNKAKCSSIEIYVEDGKIKEIYEFQEPEGIIDPPSQPSSEMNRLTGFNWFKHLRPEKISDIFRK